MQTPRDIYRTPSITEIFIFNEFKNASSLLPMYQTGSTPTGYVQSYFGIASIGV